MKISKILSYVVLAIGVISAVLLYLMDSGFSKLMLDAGAGEARELPLGLSIPEVTPLYNLALVTIVVLVIVTLITVITGLFKNPSSLKKTFIGLVAFLIVIAISYALATGEESILKDGGIVTAEKSRWVGAGIISFYLFAVIAIGSMIVAGVKKSISN